jgi:hypothetical protein
MIIKKQYAVLWKKGLQVKYTLTNEWEKELHRDTKQCEEGRPETHWGCVPGTMK